MQKHEDNRRVLYSYPEAKEIHVKEDCILGNHYHKKKTEIFILHEGRCKLTKEVNGNLVERQMEIGRKYWILPNVKHRFEIKKDSILIGLNSEPYDPSDDYKWE